MTPRLMLLAPLLSLACAAPAFAQTRVGPDPGLFAGSLQQRSAATAERNLPRIGLTRDRYDENGFPVVRNGLVASVEVDQNVRIGVGRLNVTDIARPRTNVEPAGREIASRGRNIAAVGFSLRF
jgi:hypothetical protein